MQTDDQDNIDDKTELFLKCLVAGDFDEMLKLAEARIDIDTPHSLFGSTALQAACYLKHFGFVKKALKLGANPNIQSFSGKTALHSLVDSCCYRPPSEDLTIIAIAWELLKRNADPDIQDINGNTPLMMAAYKGSYYNCINLADTLLASFFDDWDMSLKEGANPDIINNDGKTALMIAEEGEHKEMIWTLKRAKERRERRAREKKELIDSFLSS